MTHAWVLHRGALGDSILLWPLLRALIAQGPVTFAASPSHAHLASRFLGVTPFSTDDRVLTLLHAPDTAPTHPIRGVTLLHAFTTTDHSGPWLRNATGLFPDAIIHAHTQPLDRNLAQDLARSVAGDVPLPTPHLNPDSPIAIHVGAGSPTKRWPLENFLRIALHHPGARLYAGEVELDRFTNAERSAFLAAGGSFLDSLDALADALLAARFLLACDSGPAHLAAALGIPTLTLFGPTDPAHWAPLGPNARTLATPARSPIDHLSTESVLEHLNAALF